MAWSEKEIDRDTKITAHRISSVDGELFAEWKIARSIRYDTQRFERQYFSLHIARPLCRSDTHVDCWTVRLHFSLTKVVKWT